MKVAVCGYPPLAIQFITNSQKNGLECKYFVSDFISDHGEKSFNIPMTAPPRSYKFL